MVRPRLTVRTPLVGVVCALLVALAGCDQQPGEAAPGVGTTTSTASSDPSASRSPGLPPDRRPVTLGFAGDLHFEDHLAALLRRRGPALEPAVTAALRRPDLMVVNLETTLTERGLPERKEFTFRSSPRALDLLDHLGVDVVSLANNHAVDYGPVGLRDTLAAVRDSPVPVIGIGRDADAAFRARTFSIRGTRIAVVGASARDEHTARFWSAGPGKPGVAVAARPRRLLEEVRRHTDRADVVVAYLHWGKEYSRCPNPKQVRYARAVAAAGADVVIGSHAHVLLGAGWRGDAYIGYGLGNFLWYNQNSVDTGILELTIRNGDVVADSFRPARIRADGRPMLLDGRPRAAAITRWQRLRGCAELAARPPAP
jgi:poly-gamma-glutamate synthesis protein (capsule biosynthesis protein)